MEQIKSPRKVPRPRSTSLTLGVQRKSCCICDKSMVYCKACDACYCSPCFKEEHCHPNLKGHQEESNKEVTSLCLICREGNGVWCHDCALYFCGSCFEVEHEHPAFHSHTSTPRFTRWEINMDEVHFVNRLGEGGFGCVFKATWRGQTVAVKRLLEQTISKDIQSDFVQEAEALQQLAYTNHKNIIELLGMCTKPHNLCLMMEYCELGSLSTMLQRQNFDALGQFANLAFQIADGMAFLHLRGIIHRDLASRNVLLKLQEDQTLLIKITDFGMSRFHKAAIHQTTSSLIPWKWAAPEAVEQLYCKESDVWAYGITLLEILNRGDPYPGMSGVDVFTKVAAAELSPEIPSNCPNQFVDILRDCWKYNPKDRTSFEQICTKIKNIM